MQRTLLTLLIVLGACAEKAPPAAAPKEEAARPTDRDTWWKSATETASGAEKMLAPREMRVLLKQGAAFGFDADGAWWSERRTWVFDRILQMDPDDEEANAGKGFRTLQSVPGFKDVWDRMLSARVTTDDIDKLIQQYDGRVQSGEPVFLSPEGFAVESARLGSAKTHLDRLAEDPAYEALQVAVARVRGTSLSDYPFVHQTAGPFLLFLCARDLQRIEGDEKAAETARIAARREVYQRRLAELGELHVALLKDIEQLYPALWKRHAPGPRDIHYQWIFLERDWYTDFVQRIHKQDPESTHRSGFMDGATGWAYLYEPAEVKAKGELAKGQRPPPKPDAVVRETAVYLAAQQLLHGWGKDGLTNRLERSQAYWLKEGWPAFLASRRVKEPLVGPLLGEAKRFQRILPPLQRVVERESRIELARYRDPEHIYESEEDQRVPLAVGEAFTDLAWLLVRHLNADASRPGFERYLLSQIAGENNKIAWLEECLSIDGEAGWRKLSSAVYRDIKD